jgi:hypothetical protein
MLALALCLPFAGSASAVLVRAKSRFTTIDLQACKSLARQPVGGVWQCDGLDGYPVYVSEDGARSFMSFGPDPQKRRAATQTLGAFNLPFEGKTRRVAVEWRVITRDGRAIPYATIVRYFTRDGSSSGQVLVVTRVTPYEACRVAYIDALANDEAIVLARQLADERARSFDCKGEPETAGSKGKSPM